jgi:hypothetical protein
MQGDAAQKIGTRQVHLDFHTSEYLPDIGKAFSKEQFQQALRIARVNAVNVFAKGHHSWSYYPTDVGRMHPHLDFDLLGAQLDACHEIGVVAPIYYTVGWSSNDAEAHPDWCMLDRDGNPQVSEPWDEQVNPDDAKPCFQWKFLCVNTGYHDHIMEQVEEICGRYPVDGLWFDIYQAHRLCFCDACTKEMREQGIDMADDAMVERFNAMNMKRHCSELRSLIARYHPAATVFFNGTTAIEHGVNFRQQMYEFNTVQDLEDLPTVWGGYDKLPLQSRYFLKAGWSITAMSGKFHTAWGEFGGFKHPDALRYEAASMIAWGARCNFGDQLHPCGEMDLSTYRNIGEAYAYVEQIEAYGIGGLPAARLGLWRSFDKVHDEGLVRMLLESQVNFDVANFSADFSEFDVVLVPGVACLSEAVAERLNSLAKSGGGLVVMGDGALNPERNKVLLDIGAQYIGAAQCDRDYLLVGDNLNAGLVTTPFLNYEPAIRVEPEAGTEVLAAIREPYFDRTYGKYTSHQNAPFKLEDAAHPGVIRNGNVIFIAHALDGMYFRHGARLHRDLFSNVLRLLHKRPMVETELPSAGRVSLLHQPQHRRYVVHLLYGPPIQRGECQVVEDLPVLHDVPVKFDLPVEVKRAVLVPAMKEVPIDGQRVTVPEFSCHCAIAFEYE